MEHGEGQFMATEDVDHGDARGQDERRFDWWPHTVFPSVTNAGTGGPMRFNSSKDARHYIASRYFPFRIKYSKLDVAGVQGACQS